MDKTLLSFDPRALRRASLAVASVALLAACDTDRPLAPAAPRIPTTAQAAIGSGAVGTLGWTVVMNQSGKVLLGGARFKVTGTNISLTVTDNDLNDEDPVPGRFRLADLKPGSIKVCEIVPPSGYLLANPSCRQVTVYANATTAVEFLHQYKPTMTTEILDLFNKPLGGGALTIKDSLGVTIMIVADNDASDLNKTAGYFRVTLPAGKHTVCPTTPPPGTTFGANPVCFTSTYQWSVTTHVGPFWVSPL